MSESASFWDQLDDALRSKGFDPYTAKVTANHVREVFSRYADHYITTVGDADASALFKKTFLGV